MSTKRDNTSSRIPLSVKNVPTQDVPSRDTSMLRKPTSQQLLRGSVATATSTSACPRATASRLPSFVSRSHLGFDRSNQENIPLVPTTATPKKRAIPTDESHSRNIVVDSPSKRSRSSKTGTDSSNTEQSISVALASDLNGIRVNESRKLPSTHVAASATARSRRPQQAPNPVPAAATATSVKTNRTLREPTEEFAMEARRRQSEQEIWRQKSLRAFPNFIFHFDSVDDSTARKYTNLIQQLGGHVDQFFSRKVTHVVTTRRVPDGPTPEPVGATGGPSTTEKAGAHKLFRPSFLAARTSSTKMGGNGARSRPIPLYSERNPLQDRPTRHYSPNDILVKAQSFGIRLWQLEKLQNILTRLMKLSLRDLDTPSKQEDLGQMLEKEKVYGTSERDPATARSTFYYFEKSARYVFVEDATLEHRPIMCIEFQYTQEDRAQRIPPPWPVVYGQTPGRCPFTYYPPKKSSPTQDEGEPLSANKLNTQQSLRRAVSLNNMVRSNLGPTFRPRVATICTNDQRQQDYPMASGNSVSITSNIASTTSNVFTDQQAGATIGLPQDRRVAELNRRMHMSNAPHRPLRTLNASPASVLVGSTASGLGIRRESGSPIVGSIAFQRGGPEQGATVRRMLGLEDKERRFETGTNGSGLQRSMSTSAINRPPSTKKPGYCENCRVKYEHFIDHINDRKHRKFATTESNFVDIDALIMRVQRPLRSVSEDEPSANYFDLDAIPSSQPEENVPDQESEDESVSAGSPDGEDVHFGMALTHERGDSYDEQGFEASHEAVPVAI
ncbi:related to Hsk1-interacting molecule 1 [Melanopsichium pennsylvanicum]|uniref:Related to Hsk1-interacting molecule 1 n=2 Tax=Melanopsichium pennsylvanicum TaxID=63383 RepID=A0AAJ4XG10_9BASI|nr:related to Hsk1-interacting molecule 1 [Melanopsichium pennsylvanicum 4]SNX81709.1 related to Hsk1-interacting molecule 1 [Melanopsichium pennsylvanicum]